MTQYRISTSDIEDYCLSHSQPVRIDNCGTMESTLCFSHKSYQMQYEEIATPNFRIGYGKGYLPDRMRLDFELDKESVEMHFTLIGSSLTKIDGLKDTIAVNKGSHNLFYAKCPTGHLYMNTGDVELFEVNMTTDLFEKYFPESKQFDAFREAMRLQIPASQRTHHYPITTAMYGLIEDIKHCKFKEEMRVLYIESKILELMMLQLDQIQQAKPKAIVSQDLKEKMIEVQRIIRNNINHPHKLSSLCAQVSTNECTLKREFKQLYGTTVFNYIRELRMERAKQLLQYENLPVSAVSEQVGYKNPQHFTTAFKEKYGITPSQLNK